MSLARGTSAPQHLAPLRDAGLVAERCDGRLMVKPLVDWIAHYQAFWFERLDRLNALLKEMDQ